MSSRSPPVAVEPPKAHHDLADWFSHAIAGRMRAVGLESLGDLATTISTAGYRWWEMVPRIGEKSATRIVQWLKENESSIGCKLSARCEVPLRSLDRQELEAIEGGGTAVLPLERFVLPEALDGSGAKNRAPAHMNRSGASDDLDAVRIWLARTAGHTFRSYRTHIERLLLWSVLQRRKSISDLDAEDLQEFFRFLEQPSPAALWIGPQGKRAERWSAAWRPFSGRMAGSSVQTAKAVLNAYFRWAVSLGYLEENPIETSD